MKKKMFGVLVVIAMSVCTMFSTVQAENSELKGPGNVTLKRLGYNAAFDPNEDIVADVIKEATGYDVELYAPGGKCR